MPLFDRISEEKIQNAMRAGEFKDLPGEGKPFPPNVFSTENRNEWSLAHDLLKKNGMNLPWIDERKNILAEIIELRTRICLVRQQIKMEDKEKKIRVLFKEEVLKINRRILDYNLRSPVLSLQLNEISLSELVQNCNKTGRETFPAQTG